MTWRDSALDDRHAAARAHPARYSPEIISALANMIPAGTHVHDPFAGTGEALGALADTLFGFTFTGTELEPEFIVDRRVEQGDATEPASYPTGPHLIVTSPPYPNGMADDYAQEGGRRFTYRQALGRPLSPRNLGRYSARRSRTKEAEHFRLADAAIACWSAQRALVNVKDFIAEGARWPVVARWCELLEAHGFTVVELVPVHTHGQGFGANRSARVDTETIIDATKED
jgi:hypothetical protein